MRWKGRKQSTNVQDHRGQAAPIGRRSMGIAGGAGIARILFSLLARSSGKMRIVIIIVAAIGFFFFKDRLLGTQSRASSATSNTEQTQSKPLNDEQKRFLGAMIGANETTWKEVLPKYNIRFRPATLHIYNNAVKMKDGKIADAGMGPFYYPSEEGIYIDPNFFHEMETRYKAGGDFANAYVVAHEYGHHIQNILGRTDWLHKSRGLSQKEYNRKSVRLELHADFLAGIFAHYEKKNFNSLDIGDIEEAIRCAQAIGDDNLQKQATGRVSPDSFTHGTSEQRARWFMKGFSSGDLKLGESVFTDPYPQL